MQNIHLESVLFHMQIFSTTYASSVCGGADDVCADAMTTWSLTLQ